MALHAADAIEQLAELAHNLWRDRMEVRGWGYGPAYNPAGKRHDAMVPFRALRPHDRRQAILGVTALDLLPRLAESVWYERGPEALLRADEMRAGLAVGWNHAHALPSPDTPPEPGRVVSWETDETGLLRALTIQWADGSRSAHDPEARELRRMGAHPAPPPRDAGP